MDWFLITEITGYVAMALVLSVAGLLIYAFFRTRNGGYLWLLAAVLIWPYVFSIIERPVAKSLLSGKPFNASMSRFLDWSGMSIGGCFVFLGNINEVIRMLLIIIAVLYLLPRRVTRIPTEDMGLSAKGATTYQPRP